MKKFYFSLISIFILSLSAWSQAIEAAEYFIDTDPGFGKGVAVQITSGDTASLKDIAVNTTGLSVGYHYLYLRVKDSKGNWGNCRRQRFYVFDNSPVAAVRDSAKLVQAEYWIDSMPVPGTGKLIELNPADTVFYNDSIPGLVLDSGEHVVSVRVEDSKGGWSLVRSDSVRNEFYELGLFVVNRPVTRPHLYEKYAITIINRSSVQLNDVFLIIRPFNKGNSVIKFPYNNIGTFSINDTINEIYTDSGYIVPIWIPAISAKSEIKIDYYLKTAATHDTNLQIQQFEMWQQGLGTENIYNNQGNIENIRHSLMFYANEEAALRLDSSLLINHNVDSFLSNMNSFYQNNISLNSYYYVPDVLKAVFKNTLQISNLNPTAEILGIMATNSIVSGINNEINDNKPTENFNCLDDEPCSFTNLCEPHFPVFEKDKFEVNSSYCEIRCRKSSDGKTPNQTDYHGAWDITPKRPCKSQKDCPYEWGNQPCEFSRDKSKSCNEAWANEEFELLAVYGGVVSDVRAWDEESVGEGNSVYIKTSCPDAGGEFIIGYFHLKKALVSANQIVSSGTPIGIVGHSGTLATHIHIVVFKDGKRVNPKCFLKKLDGSDLVPVDLSRNSYEPCEECKNCGVASKKNKNCHKRIKEICAAGAPVGGLDPNTKVGNTGFGPQRYIKPTDQLHYGLLYQNVDSATASAQIVTLLDTLDLNKVNKHSFYFESIAAGDMLIVLPPNSRLQNLDTIYRTEKINGTYVHIKGTFDTTTGIIKVVLTSLDTTTLKLVTDPLAGFLPPDTSQFHGNGLVSFKVMPNPDLPHGTLISNRAYIIFDTNPAIVTEEWPNTIDRESPSSQVDSLKRKTYNTSFTVRWKGKDAGAGIIYYDVLFKKPTDTAYTIWLQATSLTSATFTGEMDSTYQFYSDAYDSLLNKEIAPLTYDAITTIARPIANTSFHPSYFNVNCSNGENIVQWNVKNDIAGNTYEIESSINNTDWNQVGAMMATTNRENAYSFTDTAGTNRFYRIRKINVDGDLGYSGVLRAKCNIGTTIIKVYPNPAKNQFNILIETGKTQKMNFRLYDIYGRMIRRIDQVIQTGVNSLPFNVSGLPAGGYILKSESTEVNNIQRVLIKN